MKPTLQLKIGQQLAMTPQLQQAIKLLQLSSLELQSEIQEALETNPMLESEDNPSTADDGSIPDTQDTNSEQSSTSDNEIASSNSSLTTDSGSSSDADSAVIHEASAADDTQELQQNEQIPDDLPVDAAWEDTYQASTLSGSGTGLSSEQERNLLERNSTPDTLIDHLIWQLELTPMSPVDHAIGVMIIESLSDNGYLSTSLEDIRESVLKEAHLFDTPSDPTLELEEVLAVLHRIQQFDPPGIAARNLQECLSIQLKQLPEDLPWQIEASQLVAQHIELLGSHNYAQLQKKLELDEEELRMVMRLIQSLNPHPGSQLQANKTQYVIPDVIVKKDHDKWRVELNSDVSPKLRINASYASLIKQTQSSQDSQYLKDHLQEARWFIKSLQSRNETLLKVATTIVEHQIDFFEQGEQAMKPMVLNDIAIAVDMHESTISRVTTQKFIMTPKGIFELKYFFSSHVNTTGGGECSSIAIKAYIKELINNEDKRKPYSDNTIADILTKEKGINAARRTVAKYREALNIASSSKRKRLIDL